MISKVRITPETINNLTDEELDELVYNKAVYLYLGTFGESFSESDNDKLLKQIFATTVLDNEVRNGGFDSFFYNSSDLSSSALEGLRIIGADQHADLCQQAIEIDREPKAEFKDKRNPNFDPLDEQFYSFDEYEIKRHKFIRDNVTKFFD